MPGKRVGKGEERGRGRNGSGVGKTKHFFTHFYIFVPPRHVYGNSRGPIFYVLTRTRKYHQKKKTSILHVVNANLHFAYLLGLEPTPRKVIIFTIHIVYSTITEHTFFFLSIV